MACDAGVMLDLASATATAGAYICIRHIQTWVLVSILLAVVLHPVRGLVSVSSMTRALGMIAS